MRYSGELAAMEAARNLKKWCDSQCNTCGECDCPFADGVGCALGDVVPKDFKVPCRWTEDDYNLARILRRNGADTIKRTGITVIWIKGGLLKLLGSGELPEGVFEALNNNDSIRLDDIITEYEQCH